MSLPYTNFPVYIGAANGTTIDTADDWLTATQVDVKYNTAPSPKRTLGSTVATGDQFKFGQPLQAQISLTSYIMSDDSPVGTGNCYAFTQDAENSNFFPIQIGGNLFQTCYVSDYSVNIAPYQPISVSASFTCLNPPTGSEVADSNAASVATPSTMSGDSVVYGHTCEVNNITDVVGSVQSQVDFTRNYARTPVYNLGSVNASSMLLDGVEEELSMTSTGLSNFIDLSGQLLAGSVAVSLQDKDGLFDNGALVEIMTMPEGARVANQGYGVVGGETVQTSVRLKNIKL